MENDPYVEKLKKDLSRADRTFQVDGQQRMAGEDLVSTRIPMSSIRFIDDIGARAKGLNDDSVEHYLNNYQEANTAKKQSIRLRTNKKPSDPMPPIYVMLVQDPAHGNYYLGIDGRHRYTAKQKARQTEIDCIVDFGLQLTASDLENNKKLITDLDLLATHPNSYHGKSYDKEDRMAKVMGYINQGIKLSKLTHLYPLSTLYAITREPRAEKKKEKAEKKLEAKKLMDSGESAATVARKSGIKSSTLRSIRHRSKVRKTRTSKADAPYYPEVVPIVANSSGKNATLSIDNDPALSGGVKAPVDIESTTAETIESAEGSLVSVVTTSEEDLSAQVSVESENESDHTETADAKTSNANTLTVEMCRKIYKLLQAKTANDEASHFIETILLPALGNTAPHVVILKDAGSIADKLRNVEQLANEHHAERVRLSRENIILKDNNKKLNELLSRSEDDCLGSCAKFRSQFDIIGGKWLSGIVDDIQFHHNAAREMPILEKSPDVDRPVRSFCTTVEFLGLYNSIGPDVLKMVDKFLSEIEKTVFANHTKEKDQTLFRHMTRLKEVVGNVHKAAGSKKESRDLADLPA